MRHLPSRFRIVFRPSACVKASPSSTHRIVLLREGWAFKSYEFYLRRFIIQPHPQFSGRGILFSHRLDDLSGNGISLSFMGPVLIGVLPPEHAQDLALRRNAERASLPVNRQAIESRTC